MIRIAKASIKRALLPSKHHEVNEALSIAGVYQRLDIESQEIRLLILGPGKEEGIVKCSIRHPSLRGLIKPQYETISYVWRDPDVKAIVELNGSKREVPASSERVLRRFRFSRKRAYIVD